MGETSEEYKRGWNAALTGKTLVLGMDANCHSQEFADGYLAAMRVSFRGSITMEG
jgi:hypothetical protein